MSRVHVEIVGAESYGQARNIAGTERRFHHPLGRYAQNPFDRTSPLQPRRPILSEEMALRIEEIESDIQQLPTLSRELFFTDLWPGHRQDVCALVQAPRQNQLIAGLSRIAVVCRTYYEDPEGDNTHFVNEVLLQTDQGESDRIPVWGTVAAVTMLDYATDQFGFVDPDILPGSVPVSPESYDVASAGFLNRLVSVAAAHV